ncbi:membrane protease subunit (stomatin/prohibitin family) [Herbaspirillum sp. 1173]|uniref:SPFH domain-containing protein n=1 Tax=Herbaspirillum sp. 1173 TaxID=2817734 RepID=UPI0028592630|nr:SPFH domain-containing protein [Herbaspirillum sp. 1173]MDR6739386.1 membrane protease subunit (stomatin/prohibitin family) [Herbaspirillum sp. 1173]
MNLGSFIKKQFIDVLQWNEDQEGVLAWRYPMQDFEIQNGATLTVRESQLAVFVNEGQVADIFTPGNYTLTTRTLPVLTNLKNWDKLFESPFKSDVYFFSTRLQTGRKWGTPQPITIRDKDFDMIRVRAFGMYSYALSDPRVFFSRISGTREVYTREDFEDQLQGILLSTLANSLGNAQSAFLDLAANQTLMANTVRDAMALSFAQYGLTLDQFNIASFNLPDDLQVALDQRIAAGMKGGLDAAKATGYARVQAAEAIPIAAGNEGGLAGLGAGLATGVSMGQVMADALGTGAAGAQGHAAAAPAAAAGPTPAERLGQLKQLLDQGLISAADYDAAKAEILKKLIG